MLNKTSHTLISNSTLLSIVVANYNHGQYLESAIQSVLNQSCQDFELIIVDGASTDNSVGVIKKFEEHLAWWVSEEDSGQSEAFNKGFGEAKGKFLTWLNADDLLLPGTIKALKIAAQSEPESHWFCGNFIRFTNQDKKVTEINWGPHWLPIFYQKTNPFTSVYGPSSFFSRKAYEKAGPLDESLHFRMDTEYWLRLKEIGYFQHRLNHFCWAFRMHEGSKTAEFENHKLDRKTISRQKEEESFILTKYSIQRISEKAALKWPLRVMDGSYLKQLWYRHKFTGKIINECFLENPEID